MLVLTRKRGEVIEIGDEIRITIVRTGERQIRVGIDAPRELAIRRCEDPPETKPEAA
jgi:carbon storage regulator